MKLDKRIQLAALVLVLVGLLAATYATAHLMFGHAAPSVAAGIDSIVSRNLEANNLYPPAVKKNHVAKRNEKARWEQIEIVVKVGEDVSLAELSEALKMGLDPVGLDIAESAATPNPMLAQRQITIYSDDLPVFQLLLQQRRATPIIELAPAEAPEALSKEEGPEDASPPEGAVPRIALIVDDAGYDLDRALELLNLRRPMSISILPQLKYSGHIAEVAHDMGYEVMMHLPMESDERLRRSPGFITARMTEKELAWVLDRNLESIPFVEGVNNHQGSTMTRDPEAMTRVMKYLAKKDMFFIDSRTTGESVAYNIAKEVGLRAARRDVFLDNEKQVEYIKEQVLLLMREAKAKGSAIGICHVNPETTKALHEMFPIIEKEGFKLVFASELVE